MMNCKSVLLISLILFKCFTKCKPTLNSEVFYKCPAVDTSEVGVVYFSTPNSDPLNSKRFKQSPFKLANFYSLLLLSKYFKASPTDRLLFFHVHKNSSIPESNFYNRWLSDSFWFSKIPSENVNFIRVANSEEEDFHVVLQHLYAKALSYFDKRKKFILFATSDTIVGPGIFSCFSLDLSTQRRSEVSSECYMRLHQHQSYYSFLYNVPVLHHEDKFSGMFIWKVTDTFKWTKSKDALVIDNRRMDTAFDTRGVVSGYNIHKFAYKDDVFLKNKVDFADVFAIFGYELNKHESPRIEDACSAPTANNYFYRTIRRFIYDRYEPFEYKRLTKPKIPNVVHFVWFADKYKSFKFIEYLSIKSVLLVLKPERVKIHADVEPYGEYWEKLKSNSLIEVVKRERPLHKFGQDFTDAPIQHLADIARLEILLEEGGLYSDLDILWVKPLDELRHFDVEVIASNDITSYCYEFPNSIQIGTFLAQPNSSFIRDWLAAYKNYHLFPGDYTAISMCEPYKIYEKTPDKVLVNNRLQMIYFNGWGRFIPRYIDLSLSLQFESDFDWLHNGTYGYHLPRYGPLYTYGEFMKANKSEVPIQIAEYINSLPFD